MLFRRYGLFLSESLRAHQFGSSARSVRHPRGAERNCATNTAGTPRANACCSARRLVEAGVRFVSFDLWWMGCTTTCERRNGKSIAGLDVAFGHLDPRPRATWIARQHLGDGPVRVRYPKINGTAGRDHWPKVFSVVLAGGGIKKGFIYGTSDATASEPEKDPLGIEDLATTVYKQLGIVADKELMAPGDRPIEIVDGGKVVKDLIA
ncbi:MAG: DUF1501 domain-containing protein [Planctomycetota bacterium]